MNVTCSTRLRSWPHTSHVAAALSASASTSGATHGHPPALVAHCDKSAASTVSPARPSNTSAAMTVGVSSYTWSSRTASARLVSARCHDHCKAFHAYICQPRCSTTAASSGSSDWPASPRHRGNVLRGAPVRSRSIAQHRCMVPDAAVTLCFPFSCSNAPVCKNVSCCCPAWASL